MKDVQGSLDVDKVCARSSHVKLADLIDTRCVWNWLIYSRYPVPVSREQISDAVISAQPQRQRLNPTVLPLPSTVLTKQKSL